MLDLKKVSLGKDIAINFNPFTQKRVYGFIYQNFENEQLISTIHYEIEMECIQNHYNNFVFEINRKQIYIDNLAPDLKIEQIANKAAETIFPVQIKVNASGEIEAIVNSATIRKRWLPVKEYFLKYYKGETVQKIIDKTEAVLLNEKLLKQSLCQNWFFHLYFKPLYVSYTEKLYRKFVWESPVFGNQFIEYGVVHTIDEYCSETDKIIINAKGASIDERTLEEVLENCDLPKSKMAGISVESLESEMEVNYELYAEDRSIFSIIGTFRTKITEEKYKIVQVELYHLPESSSYRPESYVNAKQFHETFVSYQDEEDDDIIDIMAVARRREIERKLNPTTAQNKISLWIEEEPVKGKNNFWSSIKTTLIKKK